MTSSISSLRVSRMRPARTITSTFLIPGICSATRTFSATDSRKVCSRVGTTSTGKVPAASSAVESITCPM